MKNSRTVYSTESGRICPACSQPVENCTCRKEKRREAGDGIIRVRREVKGRGGKTVTTISGLPLDENGLSDLAAELKRRCGSGGSVKNGIIIIQGDKRDTVIQFLESTGYTVKRAGG